MKRIAVLQSSYLPWKGYFDIINDVDHFIFYDDVQFTKNDWRNRNVIKANTGTCWLTIPVGSNIDRLICDVNITDWRWAKKHWKTISQYYSKAPFFKDYKDFLEDFFLVQKGGKLSDLNQYFITYIAREVLGVTTEFSDSRAFNAEGSKSDRLINLLVQAGAGSYLSGPSAKNYIDEKSFTEAGIELHYISYAGYPEYPQFFPPYTHQVSILDLLFHTGPEAPYYIWGWREEQ